MEKPLFVMTASRRFLYEVTHRPQYSGVILAHSSTQIVFKSWRLREALLWIWIFRCCHTCSIGFKSGDWLGPFQQVDFLSLKPIASFLCCMLWIIVLLEGPPTSHPQHPGGWQQVHLKNLSLHGSIHCSFNDMKSASTTRGETAPHHDTSTSKLHCCV